MKLFYSIGVRLYGLAIRFASLFSNKAAKWVEGRRNLSTRLGNAIDPSRRWIWFHAASLGEFEQGRPLIEKIRRNHPDIAILLTFFSPSGYEVRKNYSAADAVFYMPLDTRGNARSFIESVNPILAVFVKYEIWYHHLSFLQASNIPAILISAQFRPGQIYFKPYGTFFISLLKSLQKIFVADRTSLDILNERGFNNAELAGDTRIDRAIETSRTHRDFSFLLNVLQSEEILVAGSTWPKDEAIITPLLNSGSIKGVIAPHEIDEAHLAAIESVLTVSHIRYSGLQEDSKADVVIVDTIGDLAHIYHLATIAYVGGGFGKGIHNILEAAVYRIPVIFGPNYRQFAEAVELIELGAASSISSQETFERSFTVLSDPSRRAGIRANLADYFERHEGATARIYDYICRENLLEDGLED